nr:C39 family peptidase [Neobacillus sp. Marseille-Q6967]
MNRQLKVCLSSLLLIFPIYTAALIPLRTSADNTANDHVYRSIAVAQKEPKLQDRVLLQVPTLMQFPELPRGCEVTSLTMMLNFAGVQVDKLTLASEVEKVPYLVDGVYGNPHQGFTGSMYTFNEPGLTVYHKPIEKLANRYLPNQIDNISGESFDSVKKKLNEGKPVWVIVGSTFSYLPEEYWETWNTEDGDIKVTRKVHSVLITGYDETNVYFNDPFFSEGNRSVDYQDFVTSWTQFGSQAISY